MGLSTSKWSARGLPAMEIADLEEQLLRGSSPPGTPTLGRWARELPEIMTVNLEVLLLMASSPPGTRTADLEL